MGSWSDATGSLLSTCMAAFGEEVSYTAAGYGAVVISAIFEAQSIVVDNGIPVLSKNPTLGIKVSDLGTGINPKVNDTVVVRAVTYKVVDCHDDGQGGAMLQLQRT